MLPRSDAIARRGQAKLPILLILCLAFAISFYRLDARTWHGDEMGSLHETQRLGVNANSIPYFALLGAWSDLGESEFWLRALSAIASVGLMAVTYSWVRHLCDAQTAQFTLLLLATSPFLISYTQQVRFYAVGLFCAGLSLCAFVLVLKRPSARAIGWWILASLLAVAALLLNVLLIAGQVATLFALTPRIKPRSKIILVLVTVMFALGLLAIPAVRQVMFDALAAYTNAGARYAESRGLSLAQIAKIPLTFFFLIFGESVYPFTFALVIPGLAVFAFALTRGVLQLWRIPRAFWLVVPTIAISVMLLYLVFDPLSPPTLQGASPRYLIFLVPLFYLVVAKGIQGKMTRWLIVPLMLVNLGALTSYWYGDWAYTDDQIDWRAVKSWVDPYVTSETLVLTDGRSHETARYYFPATWKVQPLGNFEGVGLHEKLDPYQRIMVLSADFHANRRASASAALQTLEAGYSKSAAWSKYPLFIYVYDRKQLRSSSSNLTSSEQGRVDIPVEIYGLEFQDLTLPVPLVMRGRAFSSTGAFQLPSTESSTNRMIELAQPRRASKIVLFTNATNVDTLAPDTPMANLIVRDPKGARQTYPLRLGRETNGWNRECVADCAKAYTWRKRFALLGAERYAEAWREFDASIFGVEIALIEPVEIQSIEFQLTSPKASFYVWGITLDP